MNVNIEELKRLAEDATPGPWLHDQSRWSASTVCGPGNEQDPIFIGGPICETRSPLGIPGMDPRCERLRKANAAYIAAFNPAVALSLIAEIERLTAMCEVHKRHHADAVAAHKVQRDELLGALKDASEKMRRCDYVQARSDILGIIAKTES